MRSAKGTALTTLVASLQLVLTAPRALADDAGFYAGASVNRVSIDETFDDGLKLDDDVTGFRLMGGYRFGDYVGVEGGYVDFGDFDDSVMVGGLEADAKADAHGFDAALVGRLPIGEAFAVNAKVGALVWDSDARLKVGGISADDGDSGTDVFYGVGADYQVTERVTLSGGYSRYKLDDVDLDQFSLGASFNF